MGRYRKPHSCLSMTGRPIIDYAMNNREEGYQRLCYRMIDEDVVYASLSSVYRVLYTAGLFYLFIPRQNKSKGIGYEQSDGVNKEWYIDISYVCECAGNIHVSGGHH